MCGGRRVFCPGPSPECTMSYSKDTGSILRPWGSLPKPKWNHIRECTRTSTHSHVSCSSQRSFLFFHLFRLLSYHVWIDWAEGGSPGKKDFAQEEPQDDITRTFGRRFLLTVVTFAPGWYLPHTMGAARGFVGVEGRTDPRSVFWVDETPDKPDMSWWILEGNLTLKPRRLLRNRRHTQTHTCVGEERR